jgi:hypothetical protein
MTADNMMKNNKIYMISSSHLGPSNHRRDEDDGGGRGGGSAMVTAVVSGVMAVAAQSGAGIAWKAPTGNKTRGTVATTTGPANLQAVAGMPTSRR